MDMADLREAQMPGAYRLRGQPEVPLAQALIAAADTDQPLRRLLLGSDAYEAVHAALTARLAEVQAQRDSAAITNYA
jgi:hypothetical protein